MYNEKFGYVKVTMDKSDYMLYQLVDDLEGVCPHLYPIETKNSIVYKGLVPRKEVKRLETLTAVSPYGRGYEIEVDGSDIYDYLNLNDFWKLSKYDQWFNLTKVEL